MKDFQTKNSMLNFIDKFLIVCLMTVPVVLFTDFVMGYRFDYLKGLTFNFLATLLLFAFHSVKRDFEKYNKNKPSKPNKPWQS